MDGQASVCKIIDEATSRPYFVQLTYYPDSSREASPESSSFDIAVTDGGQAWTAAGLTASAVKSAVQGKMRHAVAGLSTGLLEAQEAYKYEVHMKGADLDLRVKWTPAGKTAANMLGVQLTPASDPARETAAMLNLLVRNVEALQGACGQLQRQCAEYERQARSSLHLVKEYVEKKAEHDQQASVKMAALLNSKKKKLQELQGRVGQLESQLAAQGLNGGRAGGRASGAGAGGAAPMDTDHAGQPAAAAAVKTEPGADEEGDTTDKEGDEDDSDADVSLPSREQSPPRDWD